MPLFKSGIPYTIPIPIPQVKSLLITQATVYYYMLLRAKLFHLFKHTVDGMDILCTGRTMSHNTNTAGSWVHWNEQLYYYF